MTIPASPAETTRHSILPRALAAPALKLVLIGLLLLLLVIPLSYIGGLIQERQGRQAEVLAEFKRNWGPQQTVLGPILVVPYRMADGVPRRYLHVAPSQLKLTAQLQPETRKRGIFRATVYGARLAISGVFRLPAESPASELRWADSFLLMRASDLRGLPATAVLQWNGRPASWIDCAEVAEENCDPDRLLVARTALGAAPAADMPIGFDASFELRGTEAFWTVPLAKEADVTLSAPWSTPGFAGVLLPSKTDVTAEGFTASWHVSNTRVTRHRSWVSNRAIEVDASGPNAADGGARIGVELLDAVPTYRMVERASKYAIFFLSLSFLTYFLLETVSGARIHVIQYGLLGLSVALFALLLISFGEPLGFTAGYAVSALMVLAQASLYTAMVTGQRRHALTFAAVLAALFAFLYVVLILETYSLLVGSVALFAALSVMMAVTRHIEWSLGPSALAPAAAAGPKPAAGGQLDLE